MNRRYPSVDCPDPKSCLTAPFSCKPLCEGACFLFKFRQSHPYVLKTLRKLNKALEKMEHHLPQISTSIKIPSSRIMEIQYVDLSDEQVVSLVLCILREIAEEDVERRFLIVPNESNIRLWLEYLNRQLQKTGYQLPISNSLEYLRENLEQLRMVGISDERLSPQIFWLSEDFYKLWRIILHPFQNDNSLLEHVKDIIFQCLSDFTRSLKEGHQMEKDYREIFVRMMEA